MDSEFPADLDDISAGHNMAQMLYQMEKNAKRLAKKRAEAEELESSDDETGQSATDAHSNVSLVPNITPDTPTEDMKAKVVDKLDPKLVGMSVGFKNLYSGKEDKRGRFQWQDKIPEDIGKPVEDAETQKWALIIKYVKVYNDPRKTLGIHSIVVQSPLLKSMLETVLSGYPGVTVGLQRLEFSEKFEPLIHRFPQLDAAIKELEATVEARADGSGDKGNGFGGNASAEHDSSAGAAAGNGCRTGAGEVPTEKLQALSVGNGKSEEASTAASKNDSSPAVEDSGKAPETGTEAGSKGQATTLASAIDKMEQPVADDALKLRHAKLLRDILVGEFQNLIDSSLDMKAKTVMTYELLWTLFQPGHMIFSRQDGQERVFKLKSAKYGIDRNENPVYWVSLNYIEYDGSRFGYKLMNVNIPAYAGTRVITTLSAYPLQFHQHREELKTKLIERGGRVEAFAGTHYRAYDGVGWRLDSYGEKEKHSVKGRIIIDAIGWNRYNPNHAVYVTPLNRSGEGSPSIRSGARLRIYGSGDSIISRSYGSDSDPGFDDGGDDCGGGGMPIDGTFADDEKPSHVPLTTELKLICTPILRGYALKEKIWLNLFVNAVQSVSFNTRAFESLVLPENQKELILGFTATQQAYRNTYDDVIEGKGRGIIILLCGPPGVGKTLTAESVAEEMRVPLFIMSAGDLGIDSRHIESRLLSVLGMCTRWNAILLLDEADIFLEERSLHELERNKLVSIFLRVLEYHEGIMFLTTNRVQTFDPAFQSRIHISLDYPELSIESRLTVWKNFLGQHNISQAAARERSPQNPLSAIRTANTGSPGSGSGGEGGGGGEEEEEEEQDKNKTENNTDDNATENKAEQDAEKKKEEQEREREEEKAKLHHSRTQAHGITDRQLDTLALMNMNGRQIKNVLKTAQLLANQRREPLLHRHITTVLEVTQHLHNAHRENERTRNSLFT